MPTNSSTTTKNDPASPQLIHTVAVAATNSEITIIGGTDTVMAKPHRVAVYARVSTDEQSADAQLRDLREYVSNRGWSEVSEYVDEGVSGSKDSRPAWNEIWDAIQKGRTKTLVVHALDRLGRSLPHLVRIISTCVEKDITLISFRENLDLSTAQGRMIAGIFSVLAEYELAMIRERTRCGMRAAKARGSQIGPRKHYFDKDRATQLRDMGWGQIKIAKELGVGVGRVNKWIREEYISSDLR
jgi:DNA invertase Pin-like site-specific DNA recombinase